MTCESLNCAHQLHSFPAGPCGSLSDSQSPAVAESATRGRHHRFCFSHRRDGTPWGLPWEPDTSRLSVTPRGPCMSSHTCWLSPFRAESLHCFPGAAGVSTQLSDVAGCPGSGDDPLPTSPLSIRCRSPRRCFSGSQGRYRESRGSKGSRTPGLGSPVGNLRGPLPPGRGNRAARNCPENCTQRLDIPETSAWVAVSDGKLSTGARGWRGKEIRCLLEKWFSSSDTTRSQRFSGIPPG